MKVCWLVPDDYWGGVFPVGYEVCRQARAAGHDPLLLMVCSPAGAAPPGSDVPMESLHQQPHSPTAPAAILERVVDRGFDALILNCCSEADVILPHLPESIRCVYVVHNSPRRYWISAVRHSRCVDLMVAISDYVAGVVRPHLIAPEKLVTIHNGSVYPQAANGDLKRPADLLFLGGDELRKGAGDLLRIWPELLRLKFRGKLHWCGRMIEQFKARVEALPGRQQIVLHGQVPRARVFELAAQCRVLLMLSRAEAFGMVTIEAMSMGCLPVAWDVNTGTKEIAKPALHGLFARLGDFRALAGLIMEANELHPKLATGVMARAREAFSAERMWAEYERNVSRLLKLPALHRPLVHRAPPKYTTPVRPSQLLPGGIRTLVRNAFHRHPRVAYALNRYCGM